MLKIGWAKRDITMPQGVILAGQAHMRVSEGILDPLYVTALTLDDGNDYVIFLQSDTVTISVGVLNAVREELARRNTAIDPMKVLMNASHTHAGPYIGNDDRTATWGAISEVPHDGYEIIPPGVFWNFYIDMVCQAICESFDSRTEGAIAYGYGFASVAHSRRTVYTKDWSKFATNANERQNGHAKMYGNTNDETFQHYEAGTDSFANFLFTFDTEENLTGAIVNIPCPSQNSELEWLMSADYWHDVRQEIQKRYGDIFILPQCAAGGDLSPRQLHYNAAENRRYRLKYADVQIDERVHYSREIYRRKDIAQRICDAFDEVFSWASTEKFNELPIVHSVKTIYLDRRLITDEEYEYCKAELANLNDEITFVHTGDRRADLMANTIHYFPRTRCQNAINRYEVQKEIPQLPMELHVIKVGNIAFASNQFELYMDYQHRIQARSPFEQTFIIQLCGQPWDTAGTYLPTERGLQGRGYSATMFCNSIAPSGGQQLVEETVAELKRIF